MANILFVGGERDALVENSTGSYIEGGSSGEWRTPEARIGAFVLGNDSTGNDWFYRCQMTATSAEIHLNFWSVCDRFGENNPYERVMVCDASDNVIAEIHYQPSNTYLKYWDGSAYQTVTGSFNEPNHALARYNLRVKKHTSLGRVQMWFNSTLIADSGNIDLSDYGDVDHVKLGYRGDRSRNFTEVIITDDVNLGWALTTRPPNALGTDNDGTGSVTDVNEANMNLGTFMTIAASGDKQSFTMATNDVTRPVQGWTISARLARSGGTGPQSAKPYVKIGSTRYYGSTFALTLSPDSYQYTWQNNPATSAPWLNSEINDPAFEWGWEAVA